MMRVTGPESTSLSHCGIIYSATGERFTSEAIVSAKSPLRFNRVPHLIFCNQIPAS